MSSSTTGTNTPTDHPPPQTQSQFASNYISYPVSHVVSGLYRRLTDQAKNIPNTVSSISKSTSPSRPARRPSPSKNLSTSDISTNGGVYTPSYRNASPFQPPPLTPLTLAGQGLEEEEETILTKAIAEEIRLLVPPRLQLAETWRLIYSLDRDGVSLGTLFKRCADSSLIENGTSFVLVIEDGAGGIFGAYLTDPPKPHTGYYGTGECFLWRASLLPSSTSAHLLANLPPPPSAPETESRTIKVGRSTTIASPTSPKRASFSARRASLSASANAKLSPTLSPLAPSSPPSITTSAPSQPPMSDSAPQTHNLLRFKAFPYSGVNDYLILCDAHFLSVGGGDGKYGLWLDDQLEKGVSGTCLTFGNEGLSLQGDGVENGAGEGSGGGKFDVVGVEVWGVGG